jgi:hypothetical protein
VTGLTAQVFTPTPQAIEPLSRNTGRWTIELGLKGVDSGVSDMEKRWATTLSERFSGITHGYYGSTTRSNGGVLEYPSEREATSIRHVIYNRGSILFVLYSGKQFNREKLSMSRLSVLKLNS